MNYSPPTQTYLQKIRALWGQLLWLTTLTYALTPGGQIRCVIESSDIWFSWPCTAGYSLHYSCQHQLLTLRTNMTSLSLSESLINPFYNFHANVKYAATLAKKKISQSVKAEVTQKSKANLSVNRNTRSFYPFCHKTHNNARYMLFVYHSVHSSISICLTLTHSYKQTFQSTFHSSHVTLT